MTRRFIIVHAIWILCTVMIVWALFDWTWSAWGLSPENMAKPWRGLFRLVFTAFIAVLLFSTQALVARRFPFESTP